MTLPQFGQNIARIDIELADILDLNIVAPVAGDILIYDGNSWDNQPVSGDITITAGGVTAISPGVIVDADISATAEIAVSKLADGAARQVLQTDVAGTGVEWTDNVDLPGTLDVTLLATFDTAITLAEGTAQAGTDVYLARDNDGDLTLNALVGKTINLAIAGTDEYIFSASSADINANSLINVGLSGNDFGPTRFLYTGTLASQCILDTAATVSLSTVFRVKADSQGNMGDGFGSGISFTIRDDADVDNNVGDLNFRRAGADNTGDFVMRTFVAGSANEAFTVTSGGLGSFDLAGTGAGAPSLHDDKDDAMVLRQGLSGGDLEMFEGIGIVKKVPGSLSGWHINLQPMLMLTAGGVYQNRARIDAFADTVEYRLNNVEQDISTLRAQVVALGGRPEV